MPISVAPRRLQRVGLRAVGEHLSRVRVDVGGLVGEALALDRPPQQGARVGVEQVLGRELRVELAARADRVLDRRVEDQIGRGEREVVLAFPIHPEPVLLAVRPVALPA